MTGGVAQTHQYRTVGHDLRLPPVTGDITAGRQVPGREVHSLDSGRLLGEQRLYERTDELALRAPAPGAVKSYGCPVPQA